MLVWACIAPHGGPVVEELSEGNPELMVITREGMISLQRASADLDIDTFVALTPHGQREAGQITIGLTEQCTGELSTPDGGHIQTTLKSDLELATAIFQGSAALGIPVIGLVNEEGNNDPLSLDWGALIPLWFLAVPRDPMPEVVIACMCPSLPRSAMIAFGIAICRAAEAEGRRIGLICSADQGHGHAEDGPYGFSPQSEEHDIAYLQAIADNRLQDLLDWDDEWIESALTDSYPQTLALYGASLHTPMASHVASYEHPTYFGMLCAHFAPE